MYIKQGNDEAELEQVNDDVSLMHLFGETEELEVFECESIQ